MRTQRTVTLTLEHQAPIAHLPKSPQQLQQQAASNDTVTINHWRQIWLDNSRENKRIFGSFKDNGAHVLHQTNLHKPAIIIGSGPSLKHYAKHLVAHDEPGKNPDGSDRVTKYEGNPGIMTLSALHNYGFLEDLGVKVDYYVSLDAGEIVINEMFEGGTNSKEFYCERSKDKTLIAYMGTNPKLWENWKGKVLFVNSVTPDDSFNAELDAIEPYAFSVSSGGNVLGAAFYLAKAVMGSNPIIFMGADFSFGYENNFHSWKSPYDVMGHTTKHVDIYGNSVRSWPSYTNFKSWFEQKAATVPGTYINCSDGIFGSYPEGNWIGVQQKHIEEALEAYRVSSRLKPMIDDVTVRQIPLVLF